MAMIYAQSRSEMQTIISMPLDLEYSSRSQQQHQQQQAATAGVLQLLEDSSSSSGAMQCHQLDGSVICNYSSDPPVITNDGKVFNVSAQMHHGNSSSGGAAGILDSPEDLSCVPLNLPDMPSLSTGFSEPLAISGRPILEENPEQSVDDSCLEQLQSSSEMVTDVSLKGLSWQAFMVDSWFTVSDSQLLEITYDEVASGLTVEADKGFNFSPWDESFVCQKKNHFQISVQLKMKRLPKYIKTECHEIEPIRNLALHLYGVKFEAPGAIIHIEQSKTDRSKLPYEPVMLDFPTVSEQVVKATACRLHFSETTANNMRKRGKPNPDQKYFALVVAIHAYTMTCDYPIVAYVSERIIVRASNPGQFDNEGDSIWLKGINTGETTFYHGKVGINTESPEEALSIVGNVSVTGNILHPSDKRLKQNIERIHTEEMLENVRRMTLYSYSFKDNAFSKISKRREVKEAGLEKKKEVGLIAQEVQMIIPDAIHEMDFQGKNNIRLINKDRILMELIGAVQELCKEREEKSPLLVTASSVVLLASFIILLFSLLF